MHTSITDICAVVQFILTSYQYTDEGPNQKEETRMGDAFPLLLQKNARDQTSLDSRPRSPDLGGVCKQERLHPPPRGSAPH